MLTRTFKYAFNSSAFFLKAVILIPAVLMAFLGANTAHADWTKVDTYDAGTYYIDADKVKRSGYMRSFWSVLDYKAPQKTTRGLAYQSTRTHTGCVLRDISGDPGTFTGVAFVTASPVAGRTKRLQWVAITSQGRGLSFRADK